MRTREPNGLFPGASGKHGVGGRPIAGALLFLVLLGAAPGPAAAGTDQVVILSPRVGPAIDAAERAQYGLFPQIRGFESAVVAQTSEKTYIVTITRALRPDTTIELAESTVLEAAEFIEHSEAISRGAYQMGSTRPTLTFVGAPTSGAASAESLTDEVPSTEQGAARTTAADAHPDATFNVRKHVRITSATMQLNRATGYLVRMGPDTLVLDGSGRTMRIPLANVDRLEMQTGRHGHALHGMAVGFVVGLVTAAGMSLVNTSDGYLSDDQLAVGLIQVGAVPAFLLIGGSVGALVRHETWTRVPVRDGGAGKK